MNILARLTCTRLLPTADLTSLGSNVYSYVIDKPLVDVYFGSLLLAYNATTNYATLTNSTWCYCGGTLYFKTATTIVNDSISDKISIKFYIFASDKGVNSYYDPLDITSTPAFYPPIIKNFPDFNKSIENIEEGFITTNESSIELIYNFIITDNDSFYNNDFYCWNENGLLFTCFITNFSRNLTSITFSLSNPLRSLSATNTLNTTYTYFDTETFPNMFVGDSNEALPIPFHFGNCTRYSLKIVNISGVSPYGYYLNPDDMLEAVCTDYNAEPSYLVNKTWGACRIANGPTTGTVSNVITAVYHTVTYSKLTIGYTQETMFEVGDAFYLLNTGTADYRHGNIIGVNGLDVYTTPLNAIVDTSYEIVMQEFAVSITDGTNTWIPRARVDYTISVVNIPDGPFNIACKYYTINFEDYLGQYMTAIDDATKTLGILDPTKHKVHYRFRSMVSISDVGVGDFAKSIMHSAGLDNVDTASFSAINQYTLTGNPWDNKFPHVCYTIEKYQEIRNYLTDVFKPLYVFITFKSDGNFYIYKYWNIPSSGIVFDDTNVVRGSQSFSEDCDDVYSDIFYFNPDIPKASVNGLVGSLGNTRALYVNNRIKEVGHYFNDCDNGYLMEVGQAMSLSAKRTVSFSCFGNYYPDVGTSISFYGVTYMVISFTFGKISNSIVARRS